MRIDTISILGVHVARMNLQQVLDWVRIMVEQGRPRHVVTANAEIIYKSYREPDFAAILGKADLVTADGFGVVLASRILGQNLQERVTGIELIQGIFSIAEEKGWGIYFLGARPEVVEKTVLNVLSKHPMLRVAGYHHGYYSQEETAEVVSNISKAKPDILLAALGVPRQEVFIQENLKNLNIPISIGVGGSFDVLAGVVKRAPLWMQRYGLEWLYRLIKEPWRLKRMMALPKFLLAVSGQKKRTRLGTK